MKARSAVCLLGLAGLIVSAVGAPNLGPRLPPPPWPTASVTPTQTATVRIFLHSGNPNECAEVVGVDRRVDTNSLLEAMRTLVAGPTAVERARGLGGWFDENTKEMVNSAQIEGRVASVDFKDLRNIIPNALTSCGSAILLAQLDGTAKQFGVARTLYSLDGDVDSFYNWLQLSAPSP